MNHKINYASPSESANEPYIKLTVWTTNSCKWSQPNYTAFESVNDRGINPLQPPKVAVIVNNFLQHANNIPQFLWRKKNKQLRRLLAVCPHSSHSKVSFLPI